MHRGWLAAAGLGAAALVMLGAARARHEDGRP
jgi:hypothetical protein